MPMLGTTFAALQDNRGGGGETAGINPSGAGSLQLRLMRLKMMAEQQQQNQRLAAEQQMQGAALSHAAQMQSGQLGFSQQALNQKLAAEAALNAQHHGEFQTTNDRLGSEFMTREQREAASAKALQDYNQQMLAETIRNHGVGNQLTLAETEAAKAAAARAQSAFENNPDQLMNARIAARMRGQAGGAPNALAGVPASGTTDPMNPFAGVESAQPGYESAFPGEGDPAGQQYIPSPLGGQPRSPLAPQTLPNPDPQNLQSPGLEDESSNPEAYPSSGGFNMTLLNQRYARAKALEAQAQASNYGAGPDDMVIQPSAPSQGIYQSPAPSDGAYATPDDSLTDDMMRKRFGMPSAQEAQQKREMFELDKRMKLAQVNATETQASGRLLPGEERKTHAELLGQYGGLYQEGMNNLGDPEQAKNYALGRLNTLGSAAGLSKPFDASEAPAMLQPMTPEAIGQSVFGTTDFRKALNGEARNFATDQMAQYGGSGNLSPFGVLTGDTMATRWLSAPLHTGSTPDDDMQRRRYLKNLPNSGGMTSFLVPQAYQQPAMSDNLRAYLLTRYKGRLNPAQADVLTNAW